jgi:hypothetical protein
VEISASIKLFLVCIANWTIVELEIASDGEEPEDENVSCNQNEPVHDEFSLLLSCDFCSALVERIITIFTFIHFFEEVLGSVTGHINITCFHGLKFDGHRSVGTGSFEYLLLAKEASL